MIDQEDRAPSTITGQIEPQGMPTDFNAPIGRVDVEGENPLLHLNPDRIARKEASKAEQKAGLVGKFDNVPNEEKPDRSRITAGLNGCVVVELLEEWRNTYKNWYGESLHQVARGSIKDDKYGRFIDGAPIRTSLLVRDVTHEDGSRYLYTLNSIYEVLS